ncbi:MAG TPA: magnesium transporter, partial [Wenzhouxiangella sp.]|nr:magnesium transporter [Wenzhouxiangella sp.]
GDVAPRDWLRMLSKELTVAILLGLTMALAVAGVGVWRGYPDLMVELAWVVGLAMCAVIIMGSMIGVMLPFLLQRLRMDPATASAPLITSLADIGGILIYFSIANAILQLTP